MPIAASFCCSSPSLPRAGIERVENLEQLRVLDAGHTILVGTIDEPTIGIDTPEDYRAFVERWNAPAVNYRSGRPAGSISCSCFSFASRISVSGSGVGEGAASGRSLRSARWATLPLACHHDHLPIGLAS